MKEEQTKILIKTSKGTVIRSVDTIVYIVAEDSYSTIHFSNNTHLMVSKNLSQIKLPPYGFFRVHSSIIINISYIKKIRDNSVILSSEDEFPIAKRRKKDFLMALNNRFLHL